MIRSADDQDDTDTTDTTTTAEDDPTSIEAWRIYREEQRRERIAAAQFEGDRYRAMGLEHIRW